MFFFIGSNLCVDEKEQLAEFLRKNIDVFASHPYDMVGIAAEVMCNKLHSSPGYKPVKQKPRRAASKKARVVEEDVQRQGQSEK